jgi:hypothetical protein
LDVDAAITKEHELLHAPIFMHRVLRLNPSAAFLLLRNEEAVSSGFGLDSEPIEAAPHKGEAL